MDQDFPNSSTKPRNGPTKVQWQHPHGLGPQFGTLFAIKFLETGRKKKSGKATKSKHQSTARVGGMSDESESKVPSDEGAVEQQASKEQY